MKNYSTTVFYGPADNAEFIKGLQHSVNQIPPHGIFTGDNLFTFGRNLGFLDDAPFMAAFEKNAKTDSERSLIWRLHVICWAARNGLRLEGDFVDCACYMGSMARIVCDTLNFGQLNRKFYLYDAFALPEGEAYAGMQELDVYASVKQRFSDLPNVFVTKGQIPDILQQVIPEKITFLHLDLSTVEAKQGALEMLFDRLVPGAAVILNDYGWLAYRAQKDIEDPFFAERGYRVLELPTGQGLLIK
jgi:O-methyltransferase